MLRLTCSGTGRIYAKLANGSARQQLRSGSLAHNSARHCAQPGMQKATAQVLVNALREGKPMENLLPATQKLAHKPCGSRRCSPTGTRVCWSLQGATAQTAL